MRSSSGSASPRPTAPSSRAYGVLSNAQCEQIVALRARFGDDESEEATAEMATLLSAVRALLTEA